MENITTYRISDFYKHSTVQKSLLITGIILIKINIIGMFLTLRNEQIHTEMDTGFKNDIVLNEKQLWSEINIDSSDPVQYAKSLNSSVNHGIAHYWRDEGIDKYNLRVPLTENFLLYIASWIYPKKFQKYEYCDYNKAIERGVGLCSQQTYILSELLRRKDIPTEIWDLNGHVVTILKDNNGNEQNLILDPDYGVSIPFSTEAIEANPKIIAPYYSQMGYTTKRINLLIDIYGSKGNWKISGISSYTMYYFEKVAYTLKWIIPLMLLLPYAIWGTRRHHKTKPQETSLLGNRYTPSYGDSDS